MKIAARLGIAATLVLVAGCAAGRAVTHPESDAFEGLWRLDVTRSQDAGRIWEREAGEDPAEGRTAGTTLRTRPWRLPDVVRIESDGEWLRIEDRDGVLLQEIATTGIVGDDGEEDADDVVRGEDAGTGRIAARGRWRADRLLEIEYVGPRGRRTAFQTLTLEDEDRRLVVETERTTLRGTARFLQVYERSWAR